MTGDDTLARGVFRRRLLVVLVLVVLISLSGCAADYQYRDRFDFATQHERAIAHIPSEGTSANSTHIAGGVMVYQNTSDSMEVDLLIELRKVNNTTSSTGYSALADTVTVPRNTTISVNYSMPHWGPGKYIVSVAGWQFQETVIVPSNNSTDQRRPENLWEGDTDVVWPGWIYNSSNVSDSDPTEVNFSDV